MPDNVMVCHGYVTHTLKEAKGCKFCQRVFAEYEKDRKSGKIAEMLRKEGYNVPDALQPQKTKNKNR